MTLEGMMAMSSAGRLLIVGAGRGQLGLYRAAKRMGLTTIAAGFSGDYPGLALADEVCDVDISNPGALVDSARRLSIDAVVTSCMDTGVAALGAVNDALGLRGISQEVADSAFNKASQKKAFMDYGVPTSGCVFAHGLGDLDVAEESWGYPLVLKKVRSQGSEGVFVTRTHAEAAGVIAKELRDEKLFLIEEYLEGDEFGAQAFVADGEIKFVLPHGDLLYNGHAPIPVGHYLPLDQGDETYRAACDAAVAAVRASRFDNCAVNIDFRLNNGEVNVIELTGRAGANGLPELCGMYFGVDYYEQVIRVALGEDVEFTPRPRGNALLVEMVLPRVEGRVVRADTSPSFDGVEEIQSFVAVGDEARPFATLKDCLGMVSVSAGNKQECLDIASRQISASFLVQ